MKQSTQNYLKTIFSLSYANQDSRTKVTDISKKLDVSAPAVTEMLKKLAAQNYVQLVPYKGVKLTKKGLKVGQNMVRHHRLWESYLHKELGLPWDKVHDEAERLEHACSDFLINKIEEKLNFPKFDPHGNPIPDRDGNIPKLENDIPLSDCKIGVEYNVVRVVELDDKYLKYIENEGIKLGAKIKPLDYLAFDNTLICGINGKKVSLSKTATKHIFVTK